MKYDYSDLEKKVTETCGSMTEFAKRMKLSVPSISRKFDNQRAWTQKDIFKAIIILNIKPEEIARYFFCPSR